MKRLTNSPLDMSNEDRKVELISKLREAQENRDIEMAHADADTALIDFINDPLVRHEYNKVKKWYA